MVQIIGTIEFLQIQQASLKESLPDGTHQYNPTPLLRLNRIQLTPEGIIGLTETGEKLIDVHNIQHPNSRYRGDNPISIGFTSHYEMMRSEFGEHLTDGIAGESIIVRTTTLYTPERLGSHLAIKPQDSDDYIHLHGVIPTPPCEPFSRFARNQTLTPQETKATLQFLSNGTRGYYAKIRDTNSTYTIQKGDVLVQFTV